MSSWLKSYPSFAFFLAVLRLTILEVFRAPCTYCIGSISILIVVIVASAVQTLISKAPLIYLRQAETASGQIDVALAPDASNGIAFLNYSRFAASVSSADSSGFYSYSTGRLSIAGVSLWPSSSCVLPVGVSAASSFTNNSWMYAFPASSPAGPSVTLCSGKGDASSSTNACLSAACGTQAPASGYRLIAFDTVAEGRMGLGRGWKLDPLPPLSAVLSTATAAALGVSAGDILFASTLSTGSLLASAFAPAWAEAAAAGGTDAVSSSSSFSSSSSTPPSPLRGLDSIGWPSLMAEYPSLAFPLRVAAVSDASDGGAGLVGKVGQGNLDSVILVEREGLRAALASMLHPLLRALRRAAAGNASAAGSAGGGGRLPTLPP